MDSSKIIPGNNNDPGPVSGSEKNLISCNFESTNCNSIFEYAVKDMYYLYNGEHCTFSHLKERHLYFRDLANHLDFVIKSFQNRIFKDLDTACIAMLDIPLSVFMRWKHRERLYCKIVLLSALSMYRDNAFLKFLSFKKYGILDMSADSISSQIVDVFVRTSASYKFSQRYYKSLDERRLAEAQNQRDYSAQSALELISQPIKSNSELLTTLKFSLHNFKVQSGIEASTCNKVDQVSNTNISGYNTVSSHYNAQRFYRRILRKLEATKSKKHSLDYMHSSFVPDFQSKTLQKELRPNEVDYKTYYNQVRIGDDVEPVTTLPPKFFHKNFYSNLPSLNTPFKIQSGAEVNNCIGDENFLGFNSRFLAEGVFPSFPFVPSSNMDYEVIPPDTQSQLSRDPTIIVSVLYQGRCIMLGSEFVAVQKLAAMFLSSKFMSLTQFVDSIALSGGGALSRDLVAYILSCIKFKPRSTPWAVRPLDVIGVAKDFNTVANTTRVVDAKHWDSLDWNPRSNLNHTSISFRFSIAGNDVFRYTQLIRWIEESRSLKNTEVIQHMERHNRHDSDFNITSNTFNTQGGVESVKPFIETSRTHKLAYNQWNILMDAGDEHSTSSALVSLYSYCGFCPLQIIRKQHLNEDILILFSATLNSSDCDSDYSSITTFECERELEFQKSYFYGKLVAFATVTSLSPLIVGYYIGSSAITIGTAVSSRISSITTPLLWVGAFQYVFDMLKLRKCNKKG